MKLIIEGYEADILQESDGVTIIFPTLPGCQTCGNTLEEAIEFAKEALSLYLEEEF